jgi:mannosyltransferase
LFLVFLVALSLRLFRIDQEPIHIDELLTQDSAVGSLRGHMLGEATPPLYFAVMKAWSQAFGDSIVGMRIFSALVGSAATVWLVLAARGMGTAAPLAAGMSLALSPLAVWYGQVARAYALLSLCVCAWLWAVVSELHDDDRTGTVAVLATVVSAGLLTHYYFGFLLILPCAALLIAWRLWPDDRALRRLVLGHAAALPCAVMMAVLAAFQLRSGRASWIPRPTMHDLLSVPTQMFLVGPFEWPSSLLATIASVAVLVVILGTVRVAGQCLRAHRRRRLLTILVVASAVPSATVIPWAVSFGPRAIFVPFRYTIVALPPFLLLPFVAATALGRPTRRAVAGIATLAVFTAGALGLAQLYTTRQDFDWPSAAKLITASPQHTVLFLPAWLERPLRANGGQGVTAIAPQAAAVRRDGFWILGWQASRPATRRKLEEFVHRDGAEVVMASHGFQLLRVSARPERATIRGATGERELTSEAVLPTTVAVR